MGPLTKAQGGRYLERKVTIRWTDKHGKVRTDRRWLSQVVTYVRKRIAHGDPGPFEWRLHEHAPWREVRTDG